MNSLPAQLESLSVPLPAGRIVHAEEGRGEPAFWLSEEAPVPGLWRRLRLAHGESGLWPVLLQDKMTWSGDQESRPWSSGEVYLEHITDPADHDAADVLAGWWRAYAKGAMEPFTTWPGLAAAAPPAADADETADALAAELEALPRMRLALVSARRSADVLASSGWSGPVNYENDTAMFAAVVRSWEERMGVRVVCLAGFGTLRMSVGAPPVSREQALVVAAEHFAFCPDNVGDERLSGYAERLPGSRQWTFWWD